MPGADPFQAVEHGLGLGEGRQHCTVFSDVDEVMRRERIVRLEGFDRDFALSAETKNNAGRNVDFRGADFVLDHFSPGSELGIVGGTDLVRSGVERGGCGLR